MHPSLRDASLEDVPSLVQHLGRKLYLTTGRDTKKKRRLLVVLFVRAMQGNGVHRNPIQGSQDGVNT